jgi:hypothetical protein
MQSWRRRAEVAEACGKVVSGGGHGIPCPYAAVEAILKEKL